MKETSCPICNKKLTYLPRYSDLVCGECTGRAVDSNGHPVIFYNESIGGGIEAMHKTNHGETTDYNLQCYIDGQECEGIELRFGGTAVRLNRG